MKPDRDWGWVDQQVGGLENLNSMTKYPPILTYHELGERQCLVDGQLTSSATALTGELYGHEKINGVNGRIIITPAGYLIGSREELVFAQGDYIANPVLGIAQALSFIAERLWTHAEGWFKPGVVSVTYLEVFGGNVTAESREYTGNREVAARVFDHAQIYYPDLQGWSRQKVAAVRESDQSFQKFFNRDQLRDFVKTHELYAAPEVCAVPSRTLPTDLAGTMEFLKAWTPTTLCGLDSGAGGRSEGLVMRTFDRSAIVKIRYEDYERTLRKKEGQHGKR